MRVLLLALIFSGCAGMQEKEQPCLTPPPDYLIFCPNVEFGEHQMFWTFL